VVGGIYTIECLANNRIYVGSSIDLEKRLLRHKRALHAGSHYNTHLQNAWNKYGESAFVFSEWLIVSDRKDLLALENAAMDFFELDRTLFNIVRSAKSPLGFRHTSDARHRISEAQKKRFSENDYLAASRGRANATRGLGKGSRPAHSEAMRASWARRKAKVL
jgi:group I intron endonuclease